MKARFFSIGLLAVSAVLMRYPAAPTPVGAPQKRLAGFPIRMDGWTGKDDPFAASVMDVVDTDDAIHRKYDSAAGSVWLYVGYYGTRKGGRTGHVPQYCYPSAGYRIQNLGKEPLTLGNGEKVTVNRLLVERKGQQTLVLYWNESGDQKVLADGLAMNLSRLRRRLTQGRDDGAFVRITSIVTDSVERTLEREKSFAVDVLSNLGDHWPVEALS